MRGTKVRKAYNILQEGVKAMTFPVRSEQDFVEAYNCFANAVIEDRSPGTAPGAPACRHGFDDKVFQQAFKDAQVCKDLTAHNKFGYWRAYAWLSYVLVAAWLESVRKSVGPIPFGDLTTALQLAETGECACADRDGDNRCTDYVVPWVLGFYWISSDQDKAKGLDYYKEAIALNGDNNMNLVAEYSEALIAHRMFDDALKSVERAKRTRPWYGVDAAWVHYFKNSYQEALAELRRIESVPGDREFPGEGFLVAAAAYAMLNKIDEAERAKDCFLAEKAGWTLDNEKASVVFLEPADFDHWIEGCSKAGLT